MKFFILVGGSSRTTGDLIKPKKSLKKAGKKGKKGQDRLKIGNPAKPILGILKKTVRDP